MYGIQYVPLLQIYGPVIVAVVVVALVVNAVRYWAVAGIHPRA